MDDAAIPGERTLLSVLDGLAAEGYRGQFRAEPGAQISCTGCDHRFAAAASCAERIIRLEGASDPADMLAVVPLRCQQCGERGTLVVNYGPESTVEDAEVLGELERHCS